MSDTSAVYDFNPQLKKWLMVSAIDGPLKIAKQIEGVIKNYSAIQMEIKNYLLEDGFPKEIITEAINTFK